MIGAGWALGIVVKKPTQVAQIERPDSLDPPSVYEQVLDKHRIHIQQITFIFSVLQMSILSAMAMSQTKDELLRHLDLPLEVYNQMAVRYPVSAHFGTPKA